MKTKLLVTLLLLLTCYFIPSPVFAQTPDTIGSLQYNTGVPSGQPIFTITNFLPGDTIAKTVTAKNIGLSPAKSSIKGLLTTQTKQFSQVLEIVINAQGVPIYGATSPTGPKTLNQFITESQTGIFGLPLTLIQPNQTTSYEIVISLPADSGNEYQNASAIFTLIFGLTVDVPSSCSSIIFDKVVFGTNKADILNGTNKNELLLGFDRADIIHGNGGNDCIVGNNGNDILYGDSGNDIVIGENGLDTLFGGIGNDNLYGNDGIDILFGEAGSDRLDGGLMNDMVFGGENTDSCSADFSFTCELPL